MNRVKIKLSTLEECEQFLRRLNNSSIEEYVLENEDGTKSVDAKTYIGVTYAFSEFSDEIYLTNENNNYPDWIVEFIDR